MSQIIRTMIIDDEPPARALIARLLANEPDVKVIFEGCGAEAVKALPALPADLLFLDVQMPVYNGFDVLASMDPEDAPIVVFVTAFDQHAVRAFEVNAFDYILKPFEYDRVRQSLVRVRERLAERARAGHGDRFTHLLESPAARLGGWERIAVRDGRKVTFIKPAEISRVQSEGNYVKLFAGKGTLLHRDTLTAMEARLASYGFLRVSRTELVNLERVREWQPLFHGDSLLILEDGSKVQVSRTQRKALTERLGADGLS